MVSTVSRDALSAPAGSLRKLIAKFAAGQLSKQEMRQALSRAMAANPAHGAVIQKYLDRELAQRRLSSADYKELMRGLNGKKSENIPTESSNDTPDEPGIYKVDGEGTLILSDDYQPSFDAPDLPAAEKKKPAAKPAQPEPQHESGGLHPGYVLRGRYRLDEEVASGSMGLVYKATDLFKLEAGANFPIVAIKVINPEFANNRAALKSFQNEVANTQHLSHPHIVHLFELDKDKDHYFITMEWLEGESLDALLDRSQGSALAPVQAYAIIEQLCDALSYAHEQNVVHADVKPGNVFLVNSGELKLIDFGIARLEDPTNSQAKDDQDIALTPAYASCECLEKQTPVPQDDLFSLACLVYRLLSGRRVFGSSTALQAEIDGDKPVPIGGMSESRWRALENALAFRREGRQANVKVFAEEFGQRRVQRENDLEIQGISVISTDTATMQQMPEEGEIELHDTATLGVLNADGADLGPAASNDTITLESRGDTLDDSTDVASGDTANLGILPEPINFFDDNSDDSHFVPVADGPATEQVSAGTAELEILQVDPVPAETPPAPQTAAAEVPVQGVATAAPVKPRHPQTKPDIAVLANIENRLAARSVPTVSRGVPWGAVGGVAIAAAVASIGLGWKLSTDSVSSDNNAQPPLAATSFAIAPPVAASAVKPVLLDSQAPLAVGVVGDDAELALQPATEPGAAVLLAADTTVTAAEIKPIDLSETVPMAAVVPAEEVTINTADTGIALDNSVVPIQLDMVDVSPQESAAAAPVAVTTAAVIREPLTPAKPTATVTAEKRAAPPERTQARQIAQQPAPAALPSAPDAPDMKAATQPASQPASQPAAQPTLQPTVTAPVVAATVAEPVAPPASAQPVKLTASVVKPAPDPAVVMLALNSRARSAFAEGRLVKPADNSVVHWLQKMRATAPSAATTRAVAADLQSALLARAEEAVVLGDVDEAVRWTGLAADNGAEAIRLLEMRRLIDYVSAQNSPAVAAAVNVAGDTTVVATATTQKTVPLSNFEFVSYVEPNYPAQAAADNEAGWVDVRFTVGKDGRTRDIVVFGSDLPQPFEAPSIAAVEQWRFKPYESDGAIRAANSAVRLRFGD